MDVGAGTGLSGEAMRKAGFSGTIDALEPSQKMFEKAREKNIYSKYYSDFLIGNKASAIVDILLV